MSELPPIKVYTVKELAKIFNKDPETIRRWIKSGYLPAVKMGGSYVVEDETLRAILRGKNHRRKELGSLIFPIKSSYSPSEMLSDTLVAVDSTGKGWEQVQAVCDNDAILEADETGTQWTEIRLVCYIFYLYVIEDLTMRAIGQKLMEEGKHPSSAEAWSISVLSRMLEDEAYIGNAYQYMSQIVQEPGQKPRQVARPLKEQIKLPDGVIPKVIRREIFEAAQRKSQENKQYAERNNPNVEDGILRCGFIRCGYCNGSMTVKRRDTVKSEQGRIARYVCQSGSSVISNCKAPTISTQVLACLYTSHTL